MNAGHKEFAVGDLVKFETQTILYDDQVIFPRTNFLSMDDVGIWLGEEYSYGDLVFVRVLTKFGVGFSLVKRLVML